MHPSKQDDDKFPQNLFAFEQSPVKAELEKPDRKSAHRWTFRRPNIPSSSRFFALPVKFPDGNSGNNPIEFIITELSA